MKKTGPTIFITDDSKENISLIKTREINISIKLIIKLDFILISPVFLVSILFIIY